MKRSPVVCARLLAAALITSVLFAPMARSEPTEEAGLSVAPSLPVAQLGGPASLAFYGIQGTETLNIPVPPGLEPMALNAVTQLPVNVRSATITVMQDDRLIGRVDVPPEPSAPIVVPLAGARVVDSAMNVTLRTYLIPLDGYCLDPTNPLRLSDGRVDFSGVEQAPDVVADFLPPVLRALTIFVDGDPSQTEADAAVRLATAVAAHYGSQHPDIVLAALADGEVVPAEPSLPLQRHIVIRESADGGVSLLERTGMPALLMTGRPAELANESRLLTSDVNRLAVASKAVPGPLNSTPQLPADETTLRKLGQPGVNATALSPQVTIGLDQTRLGRSANNVRVHLKGSYTPLPASIGGQLVASIAGETLDHWPADTSGAVDRWVDVPAHLVQRYTSLGLRLDISGNTGRCGEFQPLTLTIDGDSPVHSTRARPPVPAGFQSMPQSLMPRTVVGIDAGFDNVRRAVAIMVGLQRLSALPIDTTVMPLQDAVEDTAPAVLISAGGWADERVTLPVAAGLSGQITVERADEPGGTATLTLDPALRFGSLQAIYDGRRSVLVATSNDAPEQLDALLGWLNEDVQRWSSVDGSALIAAPGRQPVVVSAQRPASDAPVVIEERSPVLLGIAVAVVALLASAGWFAIRRRARRSEGQS